MSIDSSTADNIAMKRTKTDETAEDLFSAAAGAEEVAPTALIASPLVAETAGWLENRAKTIGNAIRLGGGRYETFADCRGVVDVITATRLGGGQRARRHLGVVGIPNAETSRISGAEGNLTFQDLDLANVSEKTVN